MGRIQISLSGMNTGSSETKPRNSKNRAALVQAARDNLIADGVAGLRFERVAQRAGMTRKSVYNHFESRVGLIEALMDDIGERAGFTGMAPVWDLPDPRELLNAFFDSLTRSWEADRAMFRLVVGLSAADPELGIAVNARIGRVRGISAKLFEELQRAPGLSADWSMVDAKAALFALSSFTTYDDLRNAGLAQATAANRLGGMAAPIFAFD